MWSFGDLQLFMCTENVSSVIGFGSVWEGIYNVVINEDAELKQLQKSQKISQWLFSVLFGTDVFL